MGARARTDDLALRLRARRRAAGPALAVSLAMAGVLAPLSARASGAVAWGGDAVVERFYTTDLFPGGETRETDWGVRGTLKPNLTFKLGGRYRLRPWVKLEAEAYDVEHEANVQRWWTGVDLKRGGHRLRLYGGASHHELYFPSPSGNVRFDRTEGGAELRIEVLPQWLAQASLEYRYDDFAPIHDERDHHRVNFYTGLERGLGQGRRVSLIHVYRHNLSTTDLYSYDQNDLRLEVVQSLTAGLSAAGEIQGGLRNYRTGRAFAANFARQDDRWRAGLSLQRLLRAGVSAEAFGRWREIDSSRDVKNSHVLETGIALSYAR